MVLRIVDVQGAQPPMPLPDDYPLPRVAALHVPRAAPRIVPPALPRPPHSPRYLEKLLRGRPLFRKQSTR